MAEQLLDILQVDALVQIFINHYPPDTALLPPDGVLSFTHRMVMELVNDCLTKYDQGHLTSEYLTDLPQNIRTLLQQAEERFQHGDLSFIKELAQKVLSVLERPARSSERLETAEGDTEDGQNLHPEISPDPNMSQRELTSDLITDTAVLANPDSGICEIPEIQEPVASVIESLIPARKPHMNDFDTCKQIGKGGFGAVYLVRHKDSRQIFAMKKMAKLNMNTPRRLESAFLERDILTFADCPFVVSMLCSFPTKSHLCMVMEYAEGGDCETLLHSLGHLPVPLAQLYFAEAVLAVEYLHSYGIVHRDLKPDNLLITSAGHIKVTDFGLSKIGVMMPKTNIYKQLTEDITREFQDDRVCGTKYYMAPEVIMKRGYGRPVDWWSMGIILYQFLVGTLPFHGMSKAEIYEKVVTGDVVWSNDNPIPPAAQDLITKLLIKDPACRLGTEGAFEIKCHPFLSDLDFDNLLSQKPEYISEYISQLAPGMAICSCMDHSDDIRKHLVSEDEEENESFDFQNFISSSERLSKLCTTASRRMSKEDPKSPPECTPASRTNSSEMQKYVSITDDAITSLPPSSPLSEIPAHEETKSSIYFSIEQQSSENEEKGEKRHENLAHEETTSSIYLKIEQQNSENVEMEEKRQEFPAHKDRKSETNLSIDQQNSEDEAKRERIQEFPAHKDRKSEKNLSIDQQNSEDEAKRERRRGSRFRRFLSSCRRGLSRAARIFACCNCCPSTI